MRSSQWFGVDTQIVWDWTYLRIYFGKTFSFLNATEVEKYTERYLKLNSINDNQWTPGIWTKYSHVIKAYWESGWKYKKYSSLYFRLEPLPQRVDAPEEKTSGKSRYIWGIMCAIRSCSVAAINKTHV